MTRYRVYRTSGKPVEGAEAVPVNTWFEYYIEADSLDELLRKLNSDEVVVHCGDEFEVEIYDDYRE